MQDTITWSDKVEMIKFILTTKQFTNGPKVRQFEKEWSRWLGCDYSLFVSSGSTANLLLVSAIKEKYNLKDGDKVIVPACTWVTNVAPIIQCGLTPIFCDISLEHYSFDLKHLEKISKQHTDIKMIFVTHLLGFSAPTHAIKKIFPKALLIEDICESHGCRDYTGRINGSEFNGSTFSFYFGHHMTTVEGGMVSTNDYELYKLMKIKRSHGMARELPPDEFEEAKKMYPEVNSKFMFLTDGYNFRNHEICAVLGLSQLKRLNDMIESRKNNYWQFLEVLDPYKEHFYMPTSSITNSNFAMPLVAINGKKSALLKAELESAGIETRPIVSGNLLTQPFLKKYELEPESSNNIDVVHNNGVYIGNNHFIGNKEFSILNTVLSKVFS
ncbi:DegT/DnrJ/EryC1/StrS aminotransferase family protein [bacterium]|nr:DegT/DnrJ/EryC1/StrS aminotransferase family protein [bacterium]